MQKVLEKPKDYWKENFNLERNFLECFSAVVMSVRAGIVRDVVSTLYNIVDCGNSIIFVISSL